MLRENVVGIDLGTTFSVVSYLNAAGCPEIVPNQLGENKTPSAILFSEDEVAVGKEALKVAVLHPDKFADCFKRDIGNAAFRRRISNQGVPPEVLSGFMLRQLKWDAELRIGPISHAVITVPAFFDESRRKATQDAARLAGLEVLDIINEPTAAALAYGSQLGMLADGTTPTKQTLLVYDLGGGTFDVTILEIGDGNFRAIATDGDVRLGGKDFDERLVEHIAGKFLAVHGVDPRINPRDAAQLWFDAEEAKHSLSQRSRVTVVCCYAGLRTNVDISREEFEDMTRDLLERTETTTSLVLRDAKLEWSDIDRLLLVGGATRMPSVSNMLRRISNKDPDWSASPDEAVAHGAALYAGMLVRARPADEPAVRLINVNSHSLGVVGIDTQTRKRVNSIVIPRNTPLPCRVWRTFVTENANQRNVTVHVVEGESYRPESCTDLGQCVVRDLPEGLPKGTKVQVDFSYAENGRISVSARVPSARQSAEVEIERRDLHSHDDLELWSARLRGLAVDVATSEEEGPPVNYHDLASILRRLDHLFTKIGRAAIQTTLPRKLMRSVRAAQDAASRADDAKGKLAAAEAAKERAVGASETIRASSEFVRAQQAWDESSVQADFAHLVLGRDCVQANCVPERSSAPALEASELQNLMLVDQSAGQA